MSYLKTEKLKCTNKLCKYEDTYFISDQHPIYEEKLVCPKCGFKTLSVKMFDLSSVNKK